ncbi:major capsid protein [Kitasatospora sp. NPDC048545]|uniref:major capsid protein n=1 Tax=Kitasatospora sp. NPDC048545 TaxID=3157208 RepID=UPI0033E5FD52
MKRRCQYPESTGAVNQRTETLAILGGDADVDKFIAHTGGDLNDQRAIQETMKVKAASIHFADQFFNGGTMVNPLGFDGLRKRLIGRQVIDGASVGAVAGGYDFFDKLDALLSAVPGLNGSNGALYMNAALIAKIRSGFIVEPVAAAGAKTFELIVDESRQRNAGGQVLDVFDGTNAQAVDEVAIETRRPEGPGARAAALARVRLGLEEVIRPHGSHRVRQATERPTGERWHRCPGARAIRTSGDWNMRQVEKLARSGSVTLREEGDRPRSRSPPLTHRQLSASPFHTHFT